MFYCMLYIIYIGTFGGIIHIVDKGSSSLLSSTLSSSAPLSQGSNTSSSKVSSSSEVSSASSLVPSLIPMIETLTSSTQQLSFNTINNNHDDDEDDDQKHCSSDVYICYNCHQQVYIFFSYTIITTI